MDDQPILEHRDLTLREKVIDWIFNLAAIVLAIVVVGTVLYFL